MPYYQALNPRGVIRQRLGNGDVMLPDAIDVAVWGDEEPVTGCLVLHLRVIGDRLTLAGIEAQTVDRACRELTVRELSELALENLISGAIRAATISTADAAQAHDRRDPADEAERAGRARRSRHLMTEGLLEQVRTVVAGDMMGQPRQAVREHFHVSERTASRWIALAKGYQ